MELSQEFHDELWALKTSITPNQRPQNNSFPPWKSFNPTDQPIDSPANDILDELYSLSSLIFQNIAHWHIGVCNIGRKVSKTSHHAIAQWLVRQTKLNGYPPPSTQIVQSVEHWLSYQAQPTKNPEERDGRLFKSIAPEEACKVLRVQFTPSTSGGTQPKSSSLHSTKVGKQLESLISLVRESETSTTQELLKWLKAHPDKKPEFMHKIYAPGQYNQLMQKAVDWVASEKEQDVKWQEIIYTVGASKHPKGKTWMTLDESLQLPRYVDEVEYYRPQMLPKPHYRHHGKKAGKGKHPTFCRSLKWWENIDFKESMRHFYEHGHMPARNQLQLLSGELPQQTCDTSRRVPDRASGNRDVQATDGGERDTCQSQEPHQSRHGQDTLRAHSQRSTLVQPAGGQGSISE